MEFTTRRPGLKGLLAGLLAVVLLSFTLLTASGQLHRALHHQSGDEGSSCAVCLFAKGQVDLPDVLPVFTVGGFLLIGVLIVATALRAPRTSFLLPPGRAPPRLAFVS